MTQEIKQKDTGLCVDFSHSVYLLYLLYYIILYYYLIIIIYPLGKFTFDPVSFCFISCVIFLKKYKI